MPGVATCEPGEVECVVRIEDRHCFLAESMAAVEHRPWNSCAVVAIDGEGDLGDIACLWSTVVYTQRSGELKKK